MVKVIMPSMSRPRVPRYRVSSITLEGDPWFLSYDSAEDLLVIAGYHSDIEFHPHDDLYTETLEGRIRTVLSDVFFSDNPALVELMKTLTVRLVLGLPVASRYVVEGNTLALSAERHGVILPKTPLQLADFNFTEAIHTLGV